MAVRIYSLAKELKLDSKELVDVCARLGIRGKGSALASLTDEEVTKLTEHFQNPGPQSGPQSKQSAPAPERPKEPVREGKMPVLSTPRPASPLAGLRKKRLETAAAAAAAEEQAVDPSDSHVEPAAAPMEMSEEGHGPLANVMRRDDYIGPGNVGGKLPTIGPSGKEKEGSRESKPMGGTAQRGRPALKLAPIPIAETPAKSSTKKEEAIQKPDLRLPAEALRPGKTSGKPLTAHLKRHEDTLDAKRKGKTPLTPLEDDTPATGKGRRGKGKGSPGKDDAPILGGREQRQLSRQRHSLKEREGASDEYRPRRSLRRPRRTGVSTAAPRKDKVVLQLPCTVREFSEAAGVPASQILRILMEEGVMATMNALIDDDLTELIAAELGVNVELKEAVSVEDELLANIRDRQDDESELVPRPPVITFLGHVDHGKTSLLDRIIEIDVVSGESGGITQHIRAYTIEKDGKKISFVDTPGHEAFTEMRARGANVTDIAVLVVAADDGVMPQTEEAISHARAAEVPIVVALNKTDLPGVDLNRVMQGLSTNGLLPSEWGGDVEVVKTSAITGDGLDTLLDTVLTVAELHEYKANPNRPAMGTCLEAQQEAGRGVVAKIIVQNGTLRVGDVIVCGDAYGRIKAMYDTLIPEQRYEEVGPSTPVNVTGFDMAPGAGEHFYVLDDIADARTIAEARAESNRKVTLSGGAQHVTLETLFDRLEGANEVQTLNLILRADVRGSIEAIQKELGKLDHPEVKIKLLQASVGGVTEADVTLADASDAIIIGFNVIADENARNLAEQRGVQVRRYEIIYKITEDIKAALEGLLKPEEREVDLGRALVQQTYKISRVGTIAGCRVLSGTIARNGRVRIIRDNTIIGDYPIDTLKREKSDAKEVREGLECGIKLAGYNDVKEGDLFEAYKVEEVGRTFEESLDS
ncbi:translation initiation factor IF-2 [Bythopirellula polymerisocia]|uniref:Translation initiation factor IF-2 n=1 Tax=Bythopirellula polymerisocia TaxID=2528003 RepID=A0A5C6CCX7_9BACT|nr:translation initiation factor IF-2 [Bythopirellula polymerisocia]TWU21982.1 Translation initiation factor IF-2 [Bythopirellula polymerisocia]